MENKRKKTNLLIKPDFQFKFLRQLLILMVAVYFVVILVSYWFFGPVFSFISTLNLTPEQIYIAERLQALAPIMAGLLFVVMALFFFAASLIISHKIAGPVYSLERSLNEMITEGKLKSIHFREGDHFKELEAKFEELKNRVN